MKENWWESTPEGDAHYICRLINASGDVEREVAIDAQSPAEAVKQAAGMAQELSMTGSVGYELRLDNRILAWVRAVHSPLH